MRIAAGSRLAAHNGIHFLVTDCIEGETLHRPIAARTAATGRRSQALPLEVRTLIRTIGVKSTTSSCASVDLLQLAVRGLQDSIA